MLAVSIDALKTRGVAGASGRSTSSTRLEACGKPAFLTIIYILNIILYKQNTYFVDQKFPPLRFYDFSLQILFQEIEIGHL
jgi:hypothetical protein